MPKGVYDHSMFKGEGNSRWKGDSIAYVHLHKWIIYNKGKPVACEHCGVKNIRLHWANKDHTYKRNLTDWIALCTKCHDKYDRKLGFRNGNKEQNYVKNPIYHK